MRGELESIGKIWSAVAEVSLPRVPRGHEPATPLFPSARNCPQHDAKAVSPSYARKLASDFRLRAPRYAVTGCHRTPNQLLPFSYAIYLDPIRKGSRRSSRSEVVHDKVQDVVSFGAVHDKVYEIVKKAPRQLFRELRRKLDRY